MHSHAYVYSLLIVRVRSAARVPTWAALRASSPPSFTPEDLEYRTCASMFAQRFHFSIAKRLDRRRQQARHASHHEKQHIDHPMHFDFDSSLISSVRLRTPKSYPLRTLLMLINRANNICSSQNRLEMVQSSPTLPWQLALQPSFDSLSVTPRTLLCCYSAVTTALYPPFFSFYIIIWFLHQHLILFFCFFWSWLQSIWWWRSTYGQALPF